MFLIWEGEIHIRRMAGEHSISPCVDSRVFISCTGQTNEGRKQELWHFVRYTCINANVLFDGRDSESIMGCIGTLIDLIKYKSTSIRRILTLMEWECFIGSMIPLMTTVSPSRTGHQMLLARANILGGYCCSRSDGSASTSMLTIATLFEKLHV